MTQKHSSIIASSGRDKYRWLDPHIPLDLVTLYPNGAHVSRKYERHTPRRWTGGRRGKVKGMSRASHKRLMSKLMGIDWRAISAPGKRAKRAHTYFLTLTYPAEYPEDWSVYKAHLQAFLKRLRRRFGVSWLIWKLEYQRRGAPHYHIVVYFARPVSRRWLARWLSLAWYQVVGSGDKKHLKAGTKTQAAYYKDGALISYLAKYLGKEYRTEQVTGRIWGVVGVLPFVAFVARVNFVELRRRLRKWRPGAYITRANVFDLWGAAGLQLLRGLLYTVGFPDTGFKT